MIGAVAAAAGITGSYWLDSPAGSIVMILAPVFGLSYLSGLAISGLSYFRGLSSGGDEEGTARVSIQA